MDPLQGMGAVRMRVQTADAELYSSHTISQILQVCKKQIHHQDTLTLPSLTKITLPPMKKFSQIKVHRDPHICLDGVFAWKSMHISLLIQMRLQYFFIGKSSIMDRGLYFSHRWQFEVKSVLMMDLWITVMFVSAVWTLILTAPIHHKGSIGAQVK